jgi:hypothetical protein
MDEPLSRARRLRREAERLLADTGMVRLLSRYGTVTPTGSYVYDLMTWRDVDLCLALDDPGGLERAFEIGRGLAALPGVGAMYFRNEFVLETEGNPSAVFWCVEARAEDGQDWKVDVLIADPEEVARVTSPGEGLLEELTEESRASILEIKAALSREPGYRREFRSEDVYEAVLRHGVASLDEWRAWWDAGRDG